MYLVLNNANPLNMLRAMAMLVVAGYKIKGPPPAENDQTGSTIFVDTDTRVYCSTHVVKDKYMEQATRVSVEDLKAILIKEETNKSPQDGAHQHGEMVVEATLVDVTTGRKIKRSICVDCAKQAMTGSKPHLAMYRDDDTIRVLLALALAKAGVEDINATEASALDIGIAVHEALDAVARGK